MTNYYVTCYMMTSSLIESSVQVYRMSQKNVLRIVLAILTGESNFVNGTWQNVQKMSSLHTKLFGAMKQPSN